MSFIKKNKNIQERLEYFKDIIEFLFELIKHKKVNNRLYVLKQIKSTVKKINNLQCIKEKTSCYREKSLIFSTLGGEYTEDIYDDEEGILFYNGQKSARRDHLIVIGTKVWYRESKLHMHFTNIGNVKEIICLRPHSPKTPATQPIPALYALSLNKSPYPVTITRRQGDRFTHQEIFRHSGFPLERGSQPSGIYGI